MLTAPAYASSWCLCWDYFKVTATLGAAVSIATGVGDSLVEFAKAKGVDMVAVGSRGMGSMKRSLMSLVGLGSVSDYVLHQLHVVRMPP